MDTIILRPTGVQTYLSCPRKYFFSYVEQAPRLVSAALAIGSAFHKAAEVLVGALKARRSPTDVLPAAEATLEEALALEQTLGDPDPEDDKFDTAMDTALGLVRAAANAIPSTWEPATVEETAAAKISDNIEIQGTTDLVLTDGTIVDFKTRARKSSAGDIRRDLQFTAYALIRNHADNKPDQPRALSIVEITKTKVPAVHIHPTTRTANDFAAYRGIVTKVAGAIQAGYDYPAPSCFCGSCSYRNSGCPAIRAA